MNVTIGWTELIAPAIVGFGVCLIVAIVLVATERWHGRFTHDGTAGVQKFHNRPVPRIGGLAIGAGYVVLWPFMPQEFIALWGLIGLAGLPALLAGLAEDTTKRVGVRARLMMTMLAGASFALLTGYVMDDVDLPGVDQLLSLWPVALLFTAFAMGGVANAINIIDGFNGLAAGALLIMFGAFAWVAHHIGDQLVVSLALLYMAIISGFFVVNFPFGRIFLGDGGAYFCGFLLASLGVLLPARNAEISAWSAILICAYPVIETLASIHRKAQRKGSSVGQPDKVHFHMLAHRRYARRMVKRGGRAHLRNPATSVVTWTFPLVTTVFVMFSYESAFLSATFFFVSVYIYVFLYRVMSLNAPRLPLGLARIL